MNKITTVIGLSFAIFFLVGLATTLTRSMMITFWDVLPVYILMGIAIFMMLYEAFFCLLYTSPSPRDRQKSRMPSSA